MSYEGAGEGEGGKGRWCVVCASAAAAVAAERNINSRSFSLARYVRRRVYVCHSYSAYVVVTDP